MVLFFFFSGYICFPNLGGYFVEGTSAALVYKKQMLSIKLEE